MKTISDLLKEALDERFPESKNNWVSFKRNSLVFDFYSFATSERGKEILKKEIETQKQQKPKTTTKKEIKNETDDNPHTR